MYKSHIKNDRSIVIRTQKLDTFGVHIKQYFRRFFYFVLICDISALLFMRDYMILADDVHTGTLILVLIAEKCGKYFERFIGIVGLIV